MADTLVAEQLISSLKQLIINFGPTIRDAGSQDQAEDALMHLEESDENFHRYDFVKSLRNVIDNELGHIIDEELDKNSVHPNDAITGQEMLVSRITERIKSSTEFKTLTLNLKDNVAVACDHLLQNFDSEFLQEDDFNEKKRNKGRKSGIIYSDAESSFDDSSLNQSAFMFMNSQKLTKVAEDMDKKKTLDERKKALSDLAHVPSMDYQNEEQWSLIRQGIQDAVADKDEVLSKQALKFVAKGFSSSNSSSKEMYIALLDFLTMQFQGTKSTVPKIKQGVNCSKSENVKLIRCFALMNEFQRAVTHSWIRYPEKFLDDLIERTLSLLEIHQNSTVGTLSQTTPVHYLALVDTKAEWFGKWMHGFYSRTVLLKVLEKHRCIVEYAVKSVIDYASTRQVPFDTFSEISEAPSKFSSRYSQVGKSVNQRIYSGQELEFVYFVHSLKLLGNLLCYDRGRNFFPAKVKDRDEPVSVTTLLTAMIKLITEPSCATYTRSPLGSLDPCQLVTSVLKKQCWNEGIVLKTMCKDDVTNGLLVPISHLIDGSQESNTSETTLLQIADILAMIASCSAGRKHLLYGESRDRMMKSRSSPAHILAEFAKKALKGDIPTGFSGSPSKAVIGNFVYVCRQLYNTCEGLAVLYPYDLHSGIATAWKAASRESENASTPTPSMDGRDYDRQSQYILLWEDTLRDNLLNFSGTPKGVLLLQQTGAINECVSYMYSRYARKVQVGKCEKFGYGYMMSEVAATSVGMVALQKTGFISTLIRTLWGALEVVDDSPAYTPKSWPTSVIDKNARKVFSKLINLMSSFTAVYEVLGNKPLGTKSEYSFREMPDTIAGVLDRLVFLDSDAKIHSLFNVEQSHIFGLRLLSVMMCCLDTFLLLQAQYKATDILLDCQEQSRLEEGKAVVLDMLSLERNYILVKNYCIGGPSERKIPVRILPEDKAENFKSSLFSSYPPPKEYLTSITAKPVAKQESDLSKFLADTKKSSMSKDWLSNLKKAFCKVLTDKPDHARGSVLQDLLERCVNMGAKDPQESLFPLIEYTGSESNIQNYKLNDMQVLGIKKTVQYGLHLKMLTNEKESAEKLTSLVKKVCYYLQQQQRGATSSNLLCLKTGYCGFDWFTATIFLLMNGNKDKAWKLLHNFSTLISSSYLWLQRLHSSQHLPQSLRQSGISPVFSSTCHNIELVLQIEVPLVYSAFKVSGYTPAQICFHWIRQCFWNYMDWQEICHYLCVCILLGIDYQVYICVAILKYLQQGILQKTQDKDLIVFLKEEPLVGFRVGDHLEFMQQLESKFRKLVLSDMQNISRP